MMIFFSNAASSSLHDELAGRANVQTVSLPGCLEAWIRSLGAVTSGIGVIVGDLSGQMRDSPLQEKLCQYLVSTGLKIWSAMKACAKLGFFPVVRCNNGKPNGKQWAMSSVQINDGRRRAQSSANAQSTAG
jgi:hypothetical protein